MKNICKRLLLWLRGVSRTLPKIYNETFFCYNSNKVFYTAWNVSKYGVISGTYFSVFGLNTDIYAVFSPNKGKYGPKITPYVDTFHTVLAVNYFRCSLQNLGTKNVGNKMPRRLQNFSVCLGNTSAKKLPKTKQKPLHITSAMASIFRYFVKGYEMVF